jgi:aldehyde:ferredoxin oxidoreductase
MDLLLADYYRLRGWAPEGAPLPERLAALGLAAGA